MPVQNPFPLDILEKVNSPELRAWFLQFGKDGYLSAEEINAIKQALDYLYANSSDATLLARANHTGMQLASTISDFAAAVISSLSSSIYLTQSGSKLSATTSGTNTYTCNFTPAITSLTNTFRCWINFTNSNTITNPTLNPNGLGAIGFVQADGSAINIGALQGIVQLAYNGAEFQIVGRRIGTTAGSVAAGNDSRFGQVIDLFDQRTKKEFDFFDEMFYGQVQANTQFQNCVLLCGSSNQVQQSNAIFGIVPQTNNQRGISLFNTGTGLFASGIVIGGNISLIEPTVFYLDGITRSEIYVLFPILSTPTERYTFFFGFSSSNQSTSTQNEVSILYDEGAVFLGNNPSANWITRTCESSVRTITNTLVPVAINTWYKLNVICNPTLGTVVFRINDVIVATHSTNIPLTTQKITPFFRMEKRVGTANRQVAVDYYAVNQKFPSNR